MKEKVEDIIHSYQYNLNSKNELIHKLKKVYESSDHTDFMEKLWYCMLHIMVKPEGNKYADALTSLIIDFISSFHVEDENEESEDWSETSPVVIDILDSLIKHHRASSVTLRSNVCKFIGLILGSMGVNASLDEYISEAIYTSMMERLQDKSPNVRANAVIALQRLQDPSNSECPVIRTFIFHMNRDPAAKVRKSVLQNIGALKKVLPEVVKRISDESDLVRKEAYHHITRKTLLKFLTIEHRENIICRGLKDSSKPIRDIVAEKLIPNWFAQCDQNYLTLLGYFDLLGDSKAPELVLDHLFSVSPPETILKLVEQYLNDSKLVPINDITPELAFFWRKAGNYLCSDDSLSSDLLPDLSCFCDYMDSYFESTSNENLNTESLERKYFILKELLVSSLNFDLSDEVGRIRLITLTKEILLKPHKLEGLVKPCIMIFDKAIQIKSDKVDQVLQLISELQAPLAMDSQTVQTNITDQAQLQLSIMRFQINEAKIEMEMAMVNQDFLKAHELKNKLSALELAENKLKESILKSPGIVGEDVQMTEDPVVLKKCLSILIEFLYTLKSCKKATFINISAVVESLIIPCIQCPIGEVRSMAVICFGAIYSLGLSETMGKYLPLILQIAEVDISPVVQSALMALFDMILVHGLDKLHESFAAGADLEGQDLVTFLVKFLDAEDEDIREIVIAGLCKLYLTDIVTSSKLLTHLILLFFNPIAVEASPKSHGDLEVFFKVYSSYSLSNKQKLGNLFWSVMESIMEAPISSPLSTLSLDVVGTFLINITRKGSDHSGNTAMEDDPHCTIAYNILNFLISDPYDDRARALSKLLPMLEFDGNSLLSMKSISSLAEQVDLESLDKLNMKAFMNWKNNFLSSITALEEERPSTITSIIEEEEEDEFLD